MIGLPYFCDDDSSTCKTPKTLPVCSSHTHTHTTTPFTSQLSQTLLLPSSSQPLLKITLPQADDFFFLHNQSRSPKRYGYKAPAVSSRHCSHPSTWYLFDKLGRQDKEFSTWVQFFLLKEFTKRCLQLFDFRFHLGKLSL